MNKVCITLILYIILTADLGAANNQKVSLRSSKPLTTQTEPDNTPELPQGKLQTFITKSGNVFYGVLIFANGVNTILRVHKALIQKATIIDRQDHQPSQQLHSSALKTMLKLNSDQTISGQIYKENNSTIEIIFDFNKTLMFETEKMEASDTEEESNTSSHSNWLGFMFGMGGAMTLPQAKLSSYLKEGYQAEIFGIYSISQFSYIGSAIAFSYFNKAVSPIQIRYKQLSTIFNVGLQYYLGRLRVYAGLGLGYFWGEIYVGSSLAEPFTRRGQNLMGAIEAGLSYRILEHLSLGVHSAFESYYDVSVASMLAMKVRIAYAL